ncbi:helix-turn-helix domain-containing protein [Mesorhizobium sp. B2-8-5]|uniref:AlbA family DNA-binding domain-containing protein n=1 Tax=Mesorhizobium sp. B2-8-5 TaxID=2589903 RepID=UPI00112ADAB6|nr:ATP-binding protein [Mesorhizobium sp. B2-8-5]UCI24958.1 ATP-binding protein [Mesorhizobium sp. B2-8-5]
MAVLTDVQQMEVDLRHRSETLNVEFKAWMDISKSNKEGQAKIARHIAAIANHGGGRVYFGVDNDGNPEARSEAFPLEHFRSDAIHNLLKTRLEPTLQCEVRFTEFTNGVTYPVVHIPSHGTTPIGAKDESSFMHIYVRSVGPESVKISRYQQWDTILKRCMRFRDVEAVQTREEDELTRTQAMTKAITESVTASVLKILVENMSAAPATGPGVDWTTIDALTESARWEFIAQINALDFGTTETDQQVREIAGKHVVSSYALLDSANNFLTLERPHKLLKTASEEMNYVASFGWHDFIVLTNSDVSPRTRLWNIDGKDVTGVEGIRVDGRSVYFGEYDYWRAYGNSVFVTTKSYREDYHRLKGRVDHPFLTSVNIFIRMHSLLAHAAITTANAPDAEKIALFTDHRGMKDRILGRGMDYGMRVHTRLKAVEDRYFTQLVVGRAELLEDYFGTLKRLCVPILEVWGGSNFDPEEWFTRENVGQIISELRKEGSTVRLLDKELQQSA